MACVTAFRMTGTCLDLRLSRTPSPGRSNADVDDRELAYLGPGRDADHGTLDAVSPQAADGEVEDQAEDLIARGGGQERRQDRQLLDRDSERVTRGKIVSGADTEGRLRAVLGEVESGVGIGVAETDDENRAALEWVRIDIGRTVQHRAHEAFRAFDAWQMRHGAVASRDDDRPRAAQVVVRFHEPPVVRPTRQSDGLVKARAKVEPFCVILQRS